MKLKSIFSSVTVLFICGTVQTVRAEFAADWEVQVLGVYQSQIWGADEFLSGVTEFSQGREGFVEGRYTMNVQGEVVPGRLSRCQSSQPLIMRCIWQDRYGTGSLELTFSEDFLGFEGYWGADDSTPDFPWMGSR